MPEVAAEVANCCGATSPCWRDRRTVSDLKDRVANAAIGRFVARKPAPPRLPVMSEAEIAHGYGAVRQEEVA